MVNDNQSEFHLIFKSLNYLKTHWWLFLLELSAICGVYLAKYCSTPNVYESNASILVDPAKRNLPIDNMGRAMNRARLQSRRENLAQLLKSDDVMIRFRKKVTDYYNSEGRPAHLRILFPNGEAYTPKFFSSKISLKWNRRSDIFRVRCVSENPDAAHDMCQVYLNTVEAIYPEILQRRLLLQQEFLNRQIATLSSQIAERELELASFEQEDEEFYDYVILSGKKNSRLMDLRSSILSSKQQIDINKAIQRTLTSIPHKEGFDYTTFDTSIRALRSRIAEVKYKHHLTLQIKGPQRKPRLKALERELALLSGQLSQLNREADRLFTKAPLTMENVRSRLAELSMEHRINKVKLNSLVNEFQETKSKERQFRRRKLDYSRRQSEVQHTRKLLSTLYVKEQNTQLELSLGSSEVFKLQKPTRNTQRIQPQLSRHIFAGVSISLFVAMITAFMLTIFLPRIDSEAEVHRLNLPVLGKIPVCKEHFGPGDTLTPYTLEYLKIMNYRILRETKDLKCPVIIVSSPQPGEGKSTATYLLNLASQSPGRNSLFIDGDLITSHPQNFFGIQEDATPGLKSVIEGETKDIKPKDLVVSTDYDGISFLPRGGKCRTISSPSFLQPAAKIIEELRQDFDAIYIDTPPLFTSNLAHQWSGLADLIVLVARIYFTNPKDIVEALQTCKIFSKSPIGIALNCVQVTSPHRRKGSYYYFSRRRPRMSA